MKSMAIRSLPARSVGLWPPCGRLQARTRHRDGAPRPPPEVKSCGLSADPCQEIEVALKSWRISDGGSSEDRLMSRARPRNCIATTARPSRDQKSVFKIERNSGLIEMRSLIRLNGVRTNVQNGVVLSALITRRARLGDETAFLQ
jgi:hypothetical protein